MYSLFDQEWVTRVHEKELRKELSKRIETKALNKGRNEGRNEGRRETEIATANRMLSRNMPEEDVAELSGLTLAEVRELKAKMAEPVR